MSNYNLQTKVETACKSVADALALSGVTVYKGQGTEDYNPPAVICHCPQIGEEIIRTTGIFRARVIITVASQLDDETHDAHTARVATVFDAFRSDTLAAILSAGTADFHCYDANPIAFSSDVEGAEGERTLTNTLELELVVCASSIS